MNPKIPKIREEISRNRKKIAALQAQNRDLEKHLRELENLDIVGLVRSQGLTLEQFSQLFADLGCKAAYNMDGGRSAEMYYNGSVLNDPYKGGRSVSDCLIIRETFGKEP